MFCKQKYFCPFLKYPSLASTHSVYFINGFLSFYLYVHTTISMDVRNSPF